MSWIESHTVLKRHRKLIELSKEARLRPAHAMGHLHSLWHEALEQQEDGDLTKWSDEFIAAACDYPGDAPQWVRLLQKYGWLNGKMIHDWLDYAGKFLIQKYGGGKNAEGRSKIQKIWKKHGRVYGKKNADSPSESQATRKRLESDQKATLPNLPNLPNQPTTTPPRACNNREPVETVDKPVDKCLNLRRETANPEPVDKSVDNSGPLEGGETAGEQQVDSHSESLTTDKTTEAQKCAQQQRLLQLRMPFGEFRGVPIGNLDANYAAWLLEKWPNRNKLNGELLEALKLRLEIKKEELI